jgi:hypothetical protein
MAKLALDRGLYIYRSTEVIIVRGDRGNIDELISFSFHHHQKRKESPRINQQIKAANIQQLPLPR